MSNDLMDLEDKRRLELTLATREKIITSVMKDGIPGDTSSRDFLIQALDGLDRTLLAKTKIKSDNENNKSQQETTKIIAEALRRSSGKSMIDITPINPVLDNSIVVDDLVPGEKDIGAPLLSYDDIMKA